jgi:hypothetical protein
MDEANRQNQQAHLSLRILLAATLILHGLGFYQFILPAYETGVLFVSRPWQLVLGLGILTLLTELLMSILSWTPMGRKIENLFNRFSANLSNFGWLDVVGAAFLIALLTFLVYGSVFGVHLPGYTVIASLFWLVSVGVCLLLKSWSLHRASVFRLSWTAYLGIALLLTAFGYRVASFLPDISTFPFTLSWSETSRFYYASLFFSKQIYGITTPLPVLHPSRYLLQSVPFLLPSSPLWLHRAWQVFLWIGITTVTSLTLVKRLAIQNPIWRWCLSIWTVLFLLIGPVYYHLQVPAILVLIGFNSVSKDSPRLRFLTNLGTILLSSIWAGISRVNWFPMPGLLAAALYLLEEPYSGPQSLPATGAGPSLDKSSLRRWLRYTLPPVTWVILGTGAAFAAQAVYVFWSGNPASEFTSSFSSGLLWYRLWPNPTYPMGILPGIFIVSLPPVWLAWQRLKGSRPSLPTWRSISVWRFLGLVSAGVVLLIGGLIVSVKIGGGSNLHNLDAYMVYLLLVTSYFYFRRATPDKQTQIDIEIQGNVFETINFHPQSWFQSIGISAAVAVAVIFSVLGRGPVSALPDQKQVDQALSIIIRRTEAAGQSGREVLFISNRHLITFHLIRGLTLIPDYERVFLMEMAMAGNSDYLDRFHNDLKEHRFAMIVSEPLFLREKDEDFIFSEENNAWVQQISRYILCYYQEDRREKAVSIQLFAPRAETGECP